MWRCVCLWEFSISAQTQSLWLIGKSDNTTQEGIDLQSDGDWFNSSSFQVCVPVCACVYWSAAVHLEPCSKGNHSSVSSGFAPPSLCDIGLSVRITFRFPPFASSFFCLFFRMKNLQGHLLFFISIHFNTEQRSFFPT